jgi:hypothetical protein
MGSRPNQGGGLEERRNLDQAMCLFEPKASLHIDPNFEYRRCSPEGAAVRGACP